MYPTRINLLSAEKKKNLEKIITFQFAKNILEIFLAVICFSAVFLLISQNILEGFYQSLSNNAPLINSYYNSINEKIIRVNAALKDADEIQKEYYAWTPMISQITAAIPPGIQLNSMSMDIKRRQFVFAGSAKTREALLATQKSIEKIDCDKSCRVQMPIPAAQLTKKENIYFSLTAEIENL